MPNSIYFNSIHANLHAVRVTHTESVNHIGSVVGIVAFAPSHQNPNRSIHSNSNVFTFQWPFFVRSPNLVERVSALRQ